MFTGMRRCLFTRLSFRVGQGKSNKLTRQENTVSTCNIENMHVTERFSCVIENPQLDNLIETARIEMTVSTRILQMIWLQSVSQRRFLSIHFLAAHRQTPQSQRVPGTVAIPSGTLGGRTD